MTSRVGCTSQSYCNRIDIFAFRSRNSPQESFSQRVDEAMPGLCFSIGTLGLLAAASASGALAAKSPGPTIPIAPGVDLPVVSLGTGSGQHGQVANATYLWLTSGGVGIDTAYDYMDEGEVAQGIAAANVTRSEV
jgi:hypothetical protein